MIQRFQSSLVTRNILINGRRTSIRLEPELWDALAIIAKRHGAQINSICTEIATTYSDSSFTSAVRIYIFRHLMTAYQGTAAPSFGKVDDRLTA